jgi:hypothetical protein
MLAARFLSRRAIDISSGARLKPRKVAYYSPINRSLLRIVK